MNITAKAALLAAYYPFQLRVNAILMENNILNRSTVYMNGFPSLCVDTCLQEPVRTQLVNMEPFDQITAFDSISDADLTISVLASWDKMQPIINPPLPPMPTGVTGPITPVVSV